MALSAEELTNFSLEFGPKADDLLAEHSRGEQLANDRRDYLGARAVFGAALNT